MTDQPPPTHDARSQPVYDRLMHEIEQQRAKGMRKYGTELTTFNGRRADLDALQEAVDMCQYLMQRVMELEDEKLPTIRMVICGHLAPGVCALDVDGLLYCQKCAMELRGVDMHDWIGNYPAAKRHAQKG